LITISNWRRPPLGAQIAAVLDGGLTVGLVIDAAPERSLWAPDPFLISSGQGS
jgi:hypothetical protein